MKKKALRLLLVRSKHLSRPGKTNEGAALLGLYICTALTYVHNMWCAHQSTYKRKQRVNIQIYVSWTLVYDVKYIYYLYLFIENIMTLFPLLPSTNEKVCHTITPLCQPTALRFCTLAPFDDLCRNKNQKNRSVTSWVLHKCIHMNMYTHVHARIWSVGTQSSAGNNNSCNPACVTLGSLTHSVWMPGMKDVPRKNGGH